MPGIDRRLIQNFEWPLFGLALALALIGVVNLVSAASEQGAGLPPTSLRQLGWLGVGTVAMLVVLIPDYRVLERLAIPIFVGCVALLAAVLVIGPVIKGSQRWIVLGPARLQPSELAKLGLLLILARGLARRTAAGPMRLLDLIGPAAIAAVPIALVLRQPDLGTAVMLAFLAGTLLVFNRIDTRALLTIGLVGIVGVAGTWFFYLHDYQKDRLLTFLNPESDPLGAAYHAIQSQIAVGAGGLLGTGFRNGSQTQLDFLPEQQTDFVFSVLGEEWGFLGAGLVLLLYGVLFVRALMIARASRDLFGTYVAVGVTGMLFWPCLVNVAMVLGLLPVVGVPLPLLSYGGSSLLTCLAAIGLLMNISMRRYLF